MSVLLACIYIHQVHACCLQRPNEVRSPETGVIVIYHWMLGSKPRLPAKQSVLLTRGEILFSRSVTIFNMKVTNPRSLFKREALRHHLKPTASESVSKEIREHLLPL